MTIDDRQIRTPVTQVLLGYRAINRTGEVGLAVMRGKDQDECLGFIRVTELINALDSGPYLYIE